MAFIAGIGLASTSQSLLPGVVLSVEVSCGVLRCHTHLNPAIESHIQYHPIDNIDNCLIFLPWGTENTTGVFCLA